MTKFCLRSLMFFFIVYFNALNKEEIFDDLLNKLNRNDIVIWKEDLEGLLVKEKDVKSQIRVFFDNKSTLYN